MGPKYNLLLWDKHDYHFHPWHQSATTHWPPKTPPYIYTNTCSFSMQYPQIYHHIPFPKYLSGTKPHAMSLICVHYWITIPPTLQNSLFPHISTTIHTPYVHHLQHKRLPMHFQQTSTILTFTPSLAFPSQPYVTILLLNAHPNKAYIHVDPSSKKTKKNEREIHSIRSTQQHLTWPLLTGLLKYLSCKIYGLTQNHGTTPPHLTKLPLTPLMLGGITHMCICECTKEELIWTLPCYVYIFYTNYNL